MARIFNTTKEGGSWSEETKKAGELEDIVIKGEESQKPSLPRPPLQIAFDPFETIRDSLKLDESLLLAEHPEAFAWKQIYPPTLHNRRVIFPSAKAIEENVAVHFDLSKKFIEAMEKLPDEKEMKLVKWILTIADEEGKVFQSFEGKGIPSEDLIWNGKNDRGGHTLRTNRS